MTESRRLAVVVATAVLGGLVAGGTALVLSGGTVVDPERVPRSLRVADGEREARRPATGPDEVRARQAGVPTRPDERGTPPTRVRIEAADVNLPVVSMGVDESGSMALPATPYATAWYRYGADPSDPRGAVVVSGHVDTDEQGAGPLTRLAGLSEGSEIVLDHTDGSTTYSVLAVRQVPRSVLDLPALFRRDGPARLHLVTCGGAYLPARGGYQDNVVVVAAPTS